MNKVKSNFKRKDKETLVKKFFDFYIKDLKCLRTQHFLNGEVIDYYAEMLKERQYKLCKEHNYQPNNYFIPTTFMNKLENIKDNSVHREGFEYKNVQKWFHNHKLNINFFSFEKIFIPVNIKNEHWTLAVVYVKKKRIVYYDSFVRLSLRKYKGFSESLNRVAAFSEFHMQCIKKWLQEETQKYYPDERFEIDEWTSLQATAASDEFKQGVPQQDRESNDCGVFVCMFMDYLSDGLPLNFRQKEANTFREKIGVDILNGSLSYPTNVSPF